MRVRTQEIFDYKGVIGSIVHLANTDYKEVFDELNTLNYKDDELEWRKEYIIKQAIEDCDIDCFEILDGEIVEFLGLSNNKMWFVELDDKPEIEA